MSLYITSTYFLFCTFKRDTAEIIICTIETLDNLLNIQYNTLHSPNYKQIRKNKEFYTWIERIVWIESTTESDCNSLVSDLQSDEKQEYYFFGSDVRNVRVYWSPKWMVSAIGISKRYFCDNNYSSTQDPGTKYGPAVCAITKQKFTKVELCSYNLLIKLTEECQEECYSPSTGIFLCVTSPRFVLFVCLQ